MDKYNDRKDRIQVNSYQKGDRPAGAHRRTFKALVIVFCALVLLLVGSLVGLYVDISRIWGDLGSGQMAVVSEEPEQDPEAASLPQVTYEQVAVPSMEKTDEVIDVMLVGVDNRNSTKFTGRSDVLMLLRVDKDKKVIKLVSFMRDTLVTIDGHGKNKLNTAFHFGSVELANSMLQENFGLTPDYYMVVNFFGMEDIIDALDGVDITLERNELRYLNENVKEINELDRDDASRVREAGEQHLNGRQAVAYMRIRKLDGDSQRVERQHKVLEALFTKAMNMNAGQIPNLLGAVVEYVRTDIPLGRMLDIATAVRGMEGSQLQTFRYPEEFRNGSYESMSVVKPVDTEEELAKLKNFLEQ